MYPGKTCDAWKICGGGGGGGGVSGLKSPAVWEVLMRFLARRGLWCINERSEGGAEDGLRDKIACSLMDNRLEIGI